MRNKIAVIFGIALGIVAICLPLLYWYVQYPKEWRSIRNGMTRDAIKQLCPNLSEGLRDIKGDFCASESSVFVRWSLNILYNEFDRVEKAHLALFLGSDTVFKRIYVRDLAQIPHEN